jgi:ribosomal protein S18 acetylase RimI-like enzyme
MELTIRTASLDDLNILLDFEQQIIQTERPFDITIQDGKIHYYDIAKMIGLPDIEVMVAQWGSEIIGSGYARIESSKIFLKHSKHAYLGFMYVKPEHRGKGVNQKIIEALQQWAVKRGVTEFRLDVYNDNLPAIKAYQKMGFTKLLIEMRMGTNTLINMPDATP